MNSLLPSRPSVGKSASVPGVYVSLRELVMLEFKARGFSFLPRQPVHSILAGRHASRLRGRGLNFEEIRRYLPGDDIRNLDWKVTARLRSPHVRVYTEERDRPVLLLVDQRRSMFFGSRRNMKSVQAAEAAALAAWRVLSVGDRVGALVFNDDEIRTIPPHRSRKNVLQILEAVVRMNRQLQAGGGQGGNDGMFNEVMQRAIRLAKHDWLVCSISDGAGADESTVRHATCLTEHNDMLALFVYDALECELPEAGGLVFAGGELQLEIDTSGRRIRQAFHEDFQTRLEWIRSMACQRSIPVIPVQTGEGVADQVRQHLGLARKGGGRLG